MSDSVQPHRRQPARLLCPWDSLGKNTGVGCHFLLQCMKAEHESEIAQSCPTLSNPMDCSPPGSSVHGIFQARVLEWVAIAFSRWWLQRHKWNHIPQNHAWSGLNIHRNKEELGNRKSRGNDGIQRGVLWFMPWNIPMGQEHHNIPSQPVY